MGWGAVSSTDMHVWRSWRTYSLHTVRTISSRVSFLSYRRPRENRKRRIEAIRYNKFIGLRRETSEKEIVQTAFVLCCILAMRRKTMRSKPSPDTFTLSRFFNVYFFLSHLFYHISFTEKRQRCLTRLRVYDYFLPFYIQLKIVMATPQKGLFDGSRRIL